MNQPEILLSRAGDSTAFVRARPGGGIVIGKRDKRIELSAGEAKRSAEAAETLATADSATPIVGHLTRYSRPNPHVAPTPS